MGSEMCIRDRGCRAFHYSYARNYGYHDKLATIEAVDWHLVATLETPEATLDLGWRAPEESSVSLNNRQVWFPENANFVNTAIYDRRNLGENYLIDGPAIVEDPEAGVTQSSKKNKCHWKHHLLLKKLSMQGSFAEDLFLGNANEPALEDYWYVLGGILVRVHRKPRTNLSFSQRSTRLSYSHEDR